MAVAEGKSRGPLTKTLLKSFTVLNYSVYEATCLRKNWA